MKDIKQHKISLICPVFNEQGNGRYFFDKIVPILKKISPKQYANKPKADKVIVSFNIPLPQNVTDGIKSIPYAKCFI